MQLGIESSMANLLPLLTVEQCSSEPLEMTEASALKRASLLAGAILFSFCTHVASAHGSNICKARTQPMRLCIPTRFRSAARWPLKDPSLCHWRPQHLQTVCGLEGYSLYPVVQLWKRVRSQLWEHGVLSWKQEGGLCFMSTNQRIHWKDRPCPL